MSDQPNEANPDTAISTRWKKYRIVSDNYLGYEVQCWRIWMPFWLQCRGPSGPANTHPSIGKAREYARRHSEQGRVIEIV